MERMSGGGSVWLGMVVCPFKPAECLAPSLATPGNPFFFFFFILMNSSCKAMLTLIYGSEKALLSLCQGAFEALLWRH